MDENGQSDPWEAVVKRLIQELPAVKQAVPPPPPMPMVPPATPDVPIGNKIGAFLAGMGKGNGILPAIGEGMQAVDSQNQTYRALMSRGVSEADARAALANPDLMKNMLADLFQKDFTLKGDEVRFSKSPGGQAKEIARGGARFISSPEGGSIFDTQQRAMVASTAPKQPELVKDYEYYVNQERAANRTPKPFETWDLERKKVTAPQIAINQQAENKQSHDLGADWAKREIEIRRGGDKAYDELGSINIMRQAMNDPRFQGGLGSELFVLPIKQAIATFGGDPNAAASMEVFRAQANKSVLEDIGGSLGAQISNSDRDFIAAIAPRLPNTDAGNKALLDIKERIARRKIEVAQFQEDYIEKNGKVDSGFQTALRKWRETNLLFTPQDKQQFDAATAAALQRDPGTTEVPKGGAPRVRVWTPGSGLR